MPHGRHQLGRHPRGPGAGDAQRRDVGAVEIGVGQHQGPLGGDALGHGDPLVGDDPDGVGRPPRGGGDHRGHRRWRSRPRCGSSIRRGRRAAATGAGRPARTARRCRPPPRPGVVVEHRPLGQPGGAARPHHGHRIGRSQPRQPGRRRPVGGGRRRPTARAPRRPGRPAGSAPSSTTVTAGRVRSRIERTSRWPETQVDPRGDGPESGGGGVADHVVDGAREHAGRPPSRGPRRGRRTARPRRRRPGPTGRRSGSAGVRRRWPARRTPRRRR